MKACHNCDVTERIANGRFKNVAWEDIPCSSCKAADQQGFALEYDEGRGDLTPAEDEPYSGEDLMPVDVLSQVLKGLLLLPSVELNTVALRYSGLKFSEIAKLHAVTPSCSEKRVRTAMKRFPELNALFPVKASKVLRRKKHRKQV